MYRDNPKLNYIKRRLREAGVTQAAIAREVGVTRQCVWSALNRESVPRVREYVATLLGEPVESLFPPPLKRGRKPRNWTPEFCDGRRDQLPN